MGILKKILILSVFASPLFGQFGQNPFGHGAVTAAAFLPTDLGALELWFRAGSYDLADGTTVTTDWEDESGNENDATVSGNPTFETNEINGEPIVRFDGTGDFFSTNFTATFDTTGDISCYVVYNAQPTGPHGLVAALNSTVTFTGWNIRTNNVNDHIGRIGDGVTSTDNVDAPGTAGNRSSEVITFIYSDVDSSATWYISGVSVANEKQNILHNDRLFCMGKFYTDNSTLLHIGDIAEVIVYNAAHNATNQALVEGYLNSKYNF